VNRISRKRR